MSGERISFRGEEAPLPTCTQREQWARICGTTSEIHPLRPHDSVANIWLRSTNLSAPGRGRLLAPAIRHGLFFFFCRVIRFSQRRQLMMGGAALRFTVSRTLPSSFPPSVKQQQVTNRPRISASTRPPRLIRIRTVIYSVWYVELSLTPRLTSPSVYSLNVNEPVSLFSPNVSGYFVFHPLPSPLLFHDSPRWEKSQFSRGYSCHP